MELKKYIPVAALVVSIVSCSISFILARQAAITSVRPVLVFQFKTHSGWYIKNVGNGPALNVIVATRPENGTDWKQPLRIQPMPKDGEVHIQKWIDSYSIHNPRTLGMTYVDIKQREYSTTYLKGVSAIQGGNHLGTWPDSEIRRIWW